MSSLKRSQLEEATDDIIIQSLENLAQVPTNQPEPRSQEGAMERVLVLWLDVTCATSTCAYLARQTCFMICAFVYAVRSTHSGWLKFYARI
jgi:hypothetical protein